VSIYFTYLVTVLTHGHLNYSNPEIFFGISNIICEYFSLIYTAAVRYRAECSSFG